MPADPTTRTSSDGEARSRSDLFAYVDGQSVHELADLPSSRQELP